MNVMQFLLGNWLGWYEKPVVGVSCNCHTQWKPVGIIGVAGALGCILWAETFFVVLRPGIENETEIVGEILGSSVIVSADNLRMTLILPIRR